jgi:three-Cys-motif partner protein
MSENFFDHDSPHSHAKRQLIEKFVASVIQTHLKDLSVFQEKRFVMTYVDAFAGKGSFGRDDDPEVVSFNDGVKCEFYSHCEDCKVCKRGTPIIAIAVLLEHMQKLLDNQSNPLDSIGRKRLNTVKFIFNDKNLDYINALYLKISACFGSLKWKETKDLSSFSERYKAVEFEGAALQVIRIYFTNYEFKEMSFLADLEPETFILIDPFGVAGIPMPIVRKLVGNGKHVLLNLMVKHLDRYFIICIFFTVEHNI